MRSVGLAAGAAGPIRLAKKRSPSDEAFLDSHVCVALAIKNRRNSTLSGARKGAPFLEVRFLSHVAHCIQPAYGTMGGLFISKLNLWVDV